MNDDGSFEIPTTEVAGTEGIPDVLREHATLGIGLKKAALRVVEAWVDATNIDKPYGVNGDTSLITAASQGDDAEVELYLDAGCEKACCAGIAVCSRKTRVASARSDGRAGHRRKAVCWTVFARIDGGVFVLPGRTHVADK